VPSAQALMIVDHTAVDTVVRREAAFSFIHAPVRYPRRRPRLALVV
jgi:hypothetical protein